MHPKKNRGQEHHCAALMARRNRDIDVRQHRGYTQYDLKADSGEHQNTRQLQSPVRRCQQATYRRSDQYSSSKVGQHTMIKVNGRNLLESRGDSVLVKRWRYKTIAHQRPCGK